MSPVQRGRQGAASASYAVAGLNPLPAHGLCIHGRKGYSLLPILTETTDNMLLRKEQTCLSDKLKDYDL